MPKIGIRSFSANLAAAMRVQGLTLLCTEDDRWQQALDVSIKLAREKGMDLDFSRIDQTLFTTHAARSNLMHYDEHLNSYSLKDLSSRKAAKEVLFHCAKSYSWNYLHIADEFIERFRNPVESVEKYQE